MPYMIEAWDRPGTVWLRAETRPAHIDFLRANRPRLLAVGARLPDYGETAVGTLYILDTDDHAAAERFAAKHPFAQAGLFARSEVKRWRKAFFNVTDTMRRQRTTSKGGPNG